MIGSPQVNRRWLVFGVSRVPESIVDELLQAGPSGAGGQLFGREPRNGTYLTKGTYCVALLYNCVHTPSWAVGVLKLQQYTPLRFLSLH